MAPRKTQHGASATSRRTSGSGERSRSSAQARTPKAPVRQSPTRRSPNPVGAWSARLADVIPLRPSFAVEHAPARPSQRASAATCEAASATKWWAVPLAIAVIVTAFVFAYYPVAQVQYREARERARLTSELEALTARNERLASQVARLQTPEGVEDYARTQLGLVKRGEHVVVVRGASGAPMQPAGLGVPEVDSDNIGEQPVGPWTDLLDAVFGVR